MSFYRSPFAKNDTLIQGNQTNNSQNPVGEISYGTPDATVTRLIFKIDLQGLVSKISTEGISKNSIGSHKLVLKNTISDRNDLLGKTSYLDIIQRASSFQLDLFTITEDWDEGSGYDFVYADQDILSFNLVTGATNWYQRKTNIAWKTAGAYTTGTTVITATSAHTGTTITGASKIIATQIFPKGNENISIDITSYINSILYSGSTDYGLGLKFTPLYESGETLYRQAVAFHLKNTNTVFEPYLETTINDNISDDRRFFFLDKQNDLYLYSSAGDVTVTGVTIVDYNGKVMTTLTGASIVRVKTGVYKISLIVDSSIYPDAVIFNDVWGVSQVVGEGGRIKKITQDFYLIHQDRYFNFDLSNEVNPDNFYFTYFGIKSAEYIRRGDVRRVQILVKELYETPDNFYPLNLSYRIFMKQGNRTQMDLIPFTPVDRTSKGYEFTLDTSWLIPQDYYLELKFTNKSSVVTKSPIMFTIVNDDAFSS